MNAPQIVVKSCGKAGVSVEVDGRPTMVGWDLLREAATQTDLTLRAIYASILRTAEGIALRTSPLRVCYGHDSTSVWFHTYVETLWGGLRVGHQWRGMTIVAADEGGTQAKLWMVESEARDIAARIAKIAPGHRVEIVRVDS